MKKRWIIALGVVISTAAQHAVTNTGSGSSGGPTKEVARPVAIKQLKWRKGGFGNVAFASFVLENPNDFDVRDIVIACGFYGESGTEIGHHEDVIYQTIPMNGKKTVTDFNLGLINGQVSSGDCHTVTFKWYGGLFSGN